MKDEYLAIIIFVVAFIIFTMVIGHLDHNIETQDAMLDCMNSAIHTNRSLPIEEAARICGGFVK